VRDVALPGLSPSPPGLAGLHVWVADLDALGASTPETWLSADERTRAARYRLERDRRRFTRRRGWLRRVLGEHLGIAPGEVRFAYGGNGRPILADRPGLHFSLSHAGDRVLCALAARRRVGVDLTHVRPRASDDAVARALLAPGEIAGLRAMPPEARAGAFHRCWTRKEAYVKARGEGLARPLDAFEVSLSAEPWTALVRCAFDPDETARWAFLLVAPFEGHVGSIALEVCAA
jgi:4'-phosphopantetheinyl transferase